MTACRWWPDQERALQPRLIFAMEATALASLTCTSEVIPARRGTVEVAGDGTPVFVTVHRPISCDCRTPRFNCPGGCAFVTTCGCTMGRTKGAGHHFDRHEQSLLSKPMQLNLIDLLTPTYVESAAMCETLERALQSPSLRRPCQLRIDHRSALTPANCSPRCQLCFRIAASIFRVAL